MMYQTRIHKIVCLFTIATITVSLTGCGSKTSAGNESYQTIAGDLGRDTDGAKHQNAQGLVHLEAGRYEEAEKLFREALTDDVSYGPAHNNLGKALYHQSKYYHAAWEFQYAIKLMPDQPEPRNNLGMVLESIGKLDEAVEQYDQARGKAPDNAQIIGNLARTKYQRGDKDDEMRELLTEVVMKDDRAEWVSWARERLALDHGVVGYPQTETSTDTDKEPKQ